MNRQFIIKESSGRLDSALAALSGESRSLIHKRIKSGYVNVNGQACDDPALPVEAAMVLELREPPLPPAAAVPDIPILYEDDDMLVVDKPAGLAVHVGETGRQQPTVAGFARQRGVADEDDERPGIVHRLDKDTSGLLVIAKHPQAKAFLQQQFRNRTVGKKYIALVYSRLDDADATIDLPIARHRNQPTRRAVVAGGRPAVTHYHVTEEVGGYSLLDIKLETGRTHQIRVHFAHLGHPVAGDQLYGGPSPAGLQRQFLHAAYLKIASPSGKIVALESQMPDDLAEVLRKLRTTV